MGSTSKLQKREQIWDAAGDAVIFRMHPTGCAVNPRERRRLLITRCLSDAVMFPAI